VAAETVLYIATSLDGRIAGPDDDLSWLSRYADVDYDFDAFFAGIGAIIEGRRTYDIEQRIGWQLPRKVPTFVLTRAAPPAPRDNVVFTNDAPSSVLATARRSCGDGAIWIVGGADVARQYLDLGLVDRLVLSLVPVILGAGTPLFANGNRVELALCETRTFDRGLVQLTYVRG